MSVAITTRKRPANRRYRIYPGLKPNVAVIIAVLVALKSYDQSTRYPLVTRYTGVGAYSQNFVDPLSVSSNQAALARIKSFSVGIYGEKRFLLQELNLYNVALCVPLPSGGLAVSARYFGYHDYNETQLGVGYGKSLGNVDIGVQFNCHSLLIAGYGKDLLFNFEVGAILHISERVMAGVHVFNPTGSKFGSNHLEKLSSAFSAGIGYEASEKVLITAEIIKEEDKPVNINTGLQYVFANKFFARLGLYTEAAHMYFGVGLKWNSFRVDITASYHSQLGLTPGLLLVFEVSNKDE